MTIPAGIAGVALSIVFFKVYGMVTRPAVPRPVAMIVDQFAPGVEIGATVADMNRSVAEMTYVPHLGYVGIPKHRDVNMPNGYGINFAQVRLLLDEQTRRQLNPNPKKARIDAVEVVTAEGGYAIGELNTAFVLLFRRPPRDGCLRTSDEDRLREVHVWPTPNERGGVALINDFVKPDTGARHRGPTIANVIAFVGKFDGGRTLRGNYTDASCSLVLQSQ